MSSRDSLDSFLDTLKVHNKDIDACFNDALAEHHLKELVTAEIIAELERLVKNRSSSVSVVQVTDRIKHYKAKETQL